jgi:hypothetical protein
MTVGEGTAQALCSSDPQKFATVARGNTVADVQQLLAEHSAAYAASARLARDDVSEKRGAAAAVAATADAHHDLAESQVEDLGMLAGTTSMRRLTAFSAETLFTEAPEEFLAIVGTLDIADVQASIEMHREAFERGLEPFTLDDLPNEPSFAVGLAGGNG